MSEAIKVGVGTVVQRHFVYDIRSNIVRTFSYLNQVVQQVEEVGGCDNLILLHSASEELLKAAQELARAIAAASSPNLVEAEITEAELEVPVLFDTDDDEITQVSGPGARAALP